MDHGLLLRGKPYCGNVAHTHVRCAVGQEDDIASRECGIHALRRDDYHRVCRLRKLLENGVQTKGENQGKNAVPHDCIVLLRSWVDGIRQIYPQRLLILA